MDTSTRNDHKNTILIWGAGKIGRGFVADLFSRAGYAITLVDENRELVELLQKQGQYTIVNIPGARERETVTITGYTALHTTDDELRQVVAATSLIALSVFPGAFAETARGMASGIEERARLNRPLNILLCTNIMHPARLFRVELEQAVSPACHQYLTERVGLAETLVMRIAIEPPPDVRAADPLAVVTNGFPEMPMDSSALRGTFPEVPGLVAVDDIHSEEKRKLFTYNMVHALLAYLGQERRLTTIAQCLNNPLIRKTAAGALREVGEALSREFGFTQEAMEAWNARVLEHLANPILQDTIERVGSDPVRKLAREDRLCGAALLCSKHAIIPHHIIQGIGAGLRFTGQANDSSGQIREYIEQHGIRQAITAFCEFDPNREQDLIGHIEAEYIKSSEMRTERQNPSTGEST